MPRVISCPQQDAIELDDVVEYMFEQRIDTQDEDSFAEAAPMLKRLSNNRRFLSDMVANELKSHCGIQKDNTYGAQVFMLYPPTRKGQGFFMRACFWPSAEDHFVKVSGTDPFFYHKPHDHNFNFLTVGYHGPGYWSDYYEYSYEDCVGYAGEAVELKFVERSRLQRGKVMLYRAFKDIHDQLPADKFSISLNIMENSIRASVMDQYAFNLSERKVAKLINRMPSDPIFSVAAALGDDGLDEMLLSISRRHPLDRVRLAAMSARAHACASPERALEFWASTKGVESQFIREWRRLRVAELESRFELK